MTTAALVSSPASSAAVLGVGLWMPGSPDAAARPGGPAPAGGEAAGPTRPPTSRPRRRASLLTQMVAEVAAQAAGQAGLSLSAVPVVMGSAFGEMTTTLELLAEREASGDLSPTRFHNSVHNNAAGQLSIAQGNRGFSTSIAAGHETVAIVLLEAFTWLGDRGGHVLAIVADEALPAALLHGQSLPAIGAALLLSVEPPAANTDLRRPLAWIGDLRQERDRAAGSPRPPVAGSPCAAILPLIAAIGFAARPGRIDLTPGGTTHWSIQLQPSPLETKSPA